MTNGDIYICGDYEYRYNQYLPINTTKWTTDTTQNGWGLIVIDVTKTEYAPILESINGKYIKNMHNTFNGGTNLEVAPTIPSNVTDINYTFSKCTNLKTYDGGINMDGDFSGYILPSGITEMMCTFSDCKNITVAPVIPYGVKDMSYTFKQCTSLTTAPTIPSSVTDMSSTFYGCSSLSGAITINSTPNYYSKCLTGTKITEILGSCTIKTKILETKTGTSSGGSSGGFGPRV